MREGLLEEEVVAIQEVHTINLRTMTFILI